MIILVCNAGSTSLKFKLYSMPEGRVLSHGRIERVGVKNDAIFQYVNDVTGWQVQVEKQDILHYRQGILRYLDCLTDKKTGVISQIQCIDRVGYKTTVSKGHMSVHELTKEVLDGMREWLPIAPLHNQAYLDTIDAMREQLPDALFIGCFETAFHRDIPLFRRLYGVPYEWYEKYGVQRLGYHSASHSYIASVLNERIGTKYRAASCHLGGSSSVCAILNGSSIDTSFGMSLQTGLIHANRTGDLDCEVVNYLRAIGVSEKEINKGIHSDGGLKGISGVSGDLRYVEDAAKCGNMRAMLAIDAFVDGIVRYIGSFHVEMKGLDTLVFTGGIGENSTLIRQLVCEKLDVLGVELDEKANQNVHGDAKISTPGSRVRIFVIPTDEEKGIADWTYRYGSHEEEQNRRDYV